MSTTSLRVVVARAAGGHYRWGRGTLLLGGLSIALVAACIIAAGFGQYDVSPAQVVDIVLHHLGLTSGSISDPFADGAVWDIRFPRIVLAALVGAALATAGALLQGAFGNPLAEPGVVGVSSGAALTAGIAIVGGLSFAGIWTLAIFAFAGGLITALVVYALSRDGGRTEVVTLVLTGIAVNAVTNAGLSLLLFLGDQNARDQIVFWTLGSLNGTMWAYVGVVAPLVLGGLCVAFALARRLDVLSLGDRAAQHVGIDVEKLRLATIMVVATLTAAAVAFCGIIAFVGLIVPHLIRMVSGPGHRLLIPASALGGAVLLVIADTLARTAVNYAELPIGLLTSVTGGPVFFWLLRRARRTAGGWA